MDPAALERACAPCDTIINCAAPSSIVQDRVALTALALRCRYVDVGGDATVRQALEARRQDIEDRGLTFLLAAGYVPGLLEMLVRAIHAVHRGLSSAPITVQLCLVDRNEWSLNGFVDMVDRFCRNPPEIGVYRDGRFVRRSMLTSWIRKSLPGQSSKALLMPVRWHEIDRFAEDARPTQLSVCMPIDPVVYVVARCFSRFKPDRPDLAARVAMLSFRLKARRQGSGGLMYAEASGRPGRSPLRWYIELPEGRHYERTGQVAALAGAMTADRELVNPGVEYLAHVVDPHDFIVRLRIWGVETVDLTLDEVAGA
jgi:hypothetical protein